jgi:hypothetical protein
MLDTCWDVTSLLMSIEEVAVGVVMLSSFAKMTHRHREKHGELQEEEGEGERARRRRRRRRRRKRRRKRSLQPLTEWRYLLEN